jgi:hypothetical protein
MMPGSHIAHMDSLSPVYALTDYEYSVVVSDLPESDIVHVDILFQYLLTYYVWLVYLSY